MHTVRHDDDLGTPTPTRRDQPLLLCGLVAAVVVAGYLAYCAW